MWRENSTAGLRCSGPAKSPKVSLEEFAELEKELLRGSVFHGWANERWTLSRVQVLITEKLSVILSVRGLWELLRHHGRSLFHRQSAQYSAAAFAEVCRRHSMGRSPRAMTYPRRIVLPRPQACIAPPRCWTAKSQTRLILLAVVLQLAPSAFRARLPDTGRVR